MLAKTKMKLIKISNDYQKNILKIRFLKKWRKKIRKTKYLSYKRRLNIYKTDYTSDMSMVKPYHFKNTHLKLQSNVRELLHLHNVLFNKIKFNILLADVSKVQPSHTF